MLERNTNISKQNTIGTVSQLEDHKQLRPGGTSRDAEIVTMDIEQHAKDQITKYIAAKFSGHGLTRIVEPILRADGYVTAKSEPGKDGGIDILAGSGPIGFNEPRICVQVKSSQSQLDARVLRELHGVMQKVNARQGLLVSWGRFT